MKSKLPKKITLEVLARMVAEGFENTATKQDAHSLETKVSNLATKAGNLETRMGKLEHQMGALNSSVNNYLKLSERRYFELKNEHKVLENKQKILAKYLKIVIEKSKMSVDTRELESVLS